MYLCDFYLAVIRQYYTMYNFMKKSALILFTLVGLNIGIVAKAEQPLREKALAAKTYCVEKGFNELLLSGRFQHSFRQETFLCLGFQRRFHQIFKSVCSWIWQGEHAEETGI